MRILHVYAGPFPTHQGTQVYLRGLLGAQAALGHAVHLRCWADGDGTPVPGVHLRRLPRLPGATRRSGPSWGRLPRGPALVAALRSDLREGWDRIHAHHVEATLAARSLGAGPLVVHPHTALAWELPTFVSRGRRLAARAGRLLDRRVARAGEVAVALSQIGRAHV
jgi:glycosyltransferase involved in cell wall biosynthesis